MPPLPPLPPLGSFASSSAAGAPATAAAWRVPQRPPRPPRFILARLPPQLPGACLSGRHGGLGAVARTVRDLRAGRVKVLFVSPERLCSAAFQRLAAARGVLPPVSLLCLDEAHCMSQWSHNFRPSYLRLRTEAAALNARCVLALTATASRAVVSELCASLSIPACGVRVGSWQRPNLRVAVQRVADDAAKRRVLRALMAQPAFGDGACIVYVWRQVSAEVVAEFLQSEGHSAAAYHAGMDAGERAKVQAAFMRRRVRVMVATVAFGLGVDMACVRAVIHYDAPSSLEGYVQEVGRAGRDGAPAHCRLLLSDADFAARHSLAHSNHMQRAHVLGLLRAVFGAAPAPAAAAAAAAAARGAVEAAAAVAAAPPAVVPLRQAVAATVATPAVAADAAMAAPTAAVAAQSAVAGTEAGAECGDAASGGGSSSSSGSSSTGSADAAIARPAETAAAAAAAAAVAAPVHELALCIRDLEAQLDMRGEVVETVLSLLEGPPHALIRLHGTVHFRRRKPVALARAAPVVAAVLRCGALQESSAGYGCGSATASVLAVAHAAGGWMPSDVMRELQQLQRDGELEYSVGGRAQHISVLRPPPRGLNALAAALHQRMAQAEASEVSKVEAAYRALAQAADELPPEPPVQRGSGAAAAAAGVRGSRPAKRAKGAKKAAEPAEDLMSEDSDCGDADGASSAASSLLATITEYFNNGTLGSGGGSAAMGTSTAAAAAEAGSGVPDASASADAAAAAKAASESEGGGSEDSATPCSTSCATADSVPLPLRPITERVAQGVRRDFAVLSLDPGFRGLESVDGGRTVAAPHAWLMRERDAAAAAAARIMHGLGSAALPAARWRASTFWGRYREYAFEDVIAALLPRAAGGD
ncbi:hypothetical protein JKP88DRAFT_302490 [Tribonema minus]|uniref:DNA 3'-5' helicase n=1 Tax=Tribonema minus TaxID=303371 RepID=A0A835Z8Q0_9STRA|nr:hypothetical protein JKP88DRAFT_302490 [Tribonema minus]